ncbi:unnamed protein product [Gulo gulo]|uniref:Uncharacterized protein n=1 Tax=Gulo gulo TaxID=48420 RepID=A0A9X9Q8V7_GULGU|nr:unnamed protein product [Gulo gulo]
MLTPTYYREIKFRQWGNCPRHQQSGGSNPDYLGPEPVPLTPTQELPPCQPGHLSPCHGPTAQQRAQSKEAHMNTPLLFDI